MEETLKPQAAKMAGNGLKWSAMISALQPRGSFPPSSKLTAYAMYDGTECDDASGAIHPFPKTPRAAIEQLLHEGFS